MHTNDRTTILVILLVICSVFSAAAQTVTLTAPAATVRAGQQVVVTATVSGSPSFAAINYTLNAPSGWTAGTTTVGAAGTAASKVIACGATRICVVYGASNNTLIGAGVLTSVPLTIPAGTAPGPVTVAISSVVAGNAAAQPVTVTTVPLILTVLSIYDLNSDGIVNSSDIQPVVDQIVGTTSCTTADFNADGKCDSLDILLLVIKGILGL
jgi:hypothetical protein